MLLVGENCPWRTVLTVHGSKCSAADRVDGRDSVCLNENGVSRLPAGAGQIPFRYSTRSFLSALLRFSLKFAS
jgi:hypothetical protein